MNPSESSRITRSMSRAITEDSTGATGRQHDHLPSEMQRNEIITLLEDLLQPIKEYISSLLTEERIRSDDNEQYVIRNALRGERN